MRKKLFVIAGIIICVCIGLFLYIRNAINSEVSENALINESNEEAIEQEIEPEEPEIPTEVLPEETSEVANSDNDDTNSEVKDSGELELDRGKAWDFLYEEVPELAIYADYVSTVSEGRASLFSMLYPELEELHSNDNPNEVLGNYYAVYVGERWEDHNANWYWFYVNEDATEVLWCEIVEMEVFTLEEWRNTEGYKRQMEQINERLNN